MKCQRPQSIKAGERGFITLDFLFALMLAYGFASILFTVSVMLSLVEVTQYITYSTSRAYLGAHESPDLQLELAKSKYAEIRQRPILKTLFSIGWMDLPSEPELGDFSTEYSDPDAFAGDNMFVGARVSIDAKMLHLNIPFLGMATSDTKVGKATLNSFLMREVSTQECREQFNRSRWEVLKSLDSAYSQVNTQNVALITDNGC